MLYTYMQGIPPTTLSQTAPTSLPRLSTPPNRALSVPQTPLPSSKIPLWPQLNPASALLRASLSRLPFSLIGLPLMAHRSTTPHRSRTLHRSRQRYVLLRQQQHVANLQASCNTQVGTFVKGNVYLLVSLDWHQTSLIALANGSTLKCIRHES